MDLNSEEYPRFRILVVGKPGTGISTLISAVFGASLADVQHNRADAADINEEITSPHNRHLILHVFQHYDPQNLEKFDSLKEFIEGRSQKESVSERLHAIWLCITAPLDGGEIFKGDESIFKLNRSQVPIIVVFTKFDLFIASHNKARTEQGKLQDLAERKFKERYGKIFDNVTSDQAQYALVSVSLRETLCRLVNITMQSVWASACTPQGRRTGVLVRLMSKALISQSYRMSENPPRTRWYNDPLDLGQILLAAAQGVNIPIKISASIKAVKEKYWRSGVSLHKRIFRLHRSIVAIWDIRNFNEFLLSSAFYRQMDVIVNDHNRSNTSTTHRDVTEASRATGEWTKDVYEGRLAQTCCLMGYVVDIILVLQAVFQISLENGRKVTLDDVNGIIYEFMCSEWKESIHNAITAFVRDQGVPEINKTMDKIESLITETKKTDTQFAQARLLPSLLTVLRFETSPQNAINRFTLDLVGKLLDSPDYLDSISTLGDASDIELLLDFILCVLRNGHLKNCGIQDSNLKARRLVDKLSKKDVLPKTLFIGDVKTDLDSIGFRGMGSVSKGKYHEQSVALKVLYKARNNEDTRRKDFCREALAWWSLSHQFILPLLGIYEENLRLFLISPYMTNGTLIQWRKKHWPGEIHIRIKMLEVARGLEYIHSEGIVHGDLSAENVFIDSEFRCRIADFGLTRHIESTLFPSAPATSINYAAPELAGMCATCCTLECNGCPGQEKVKTTQTDVYAYGSLYYAVFFDTVPFQEEEPHQIPFLLTSGSKPSRLYDPKMNDDTWNLVEQCWFQDPSKRPTMEQIVNSHMPSPDSLVTALINELKGLGSSMVNEHTLRLMRQLLDLSEFDSITSQLTTVSDIELLLDFILHLLRNHTLTNSVSRDADRKARRLMFKLSSTTAVIPMSLFITDVKAELHLGAIDIGGLGRVFPGEHNGQSVALKLMVKSRDDESLIKDICREALAWRSLSHRFILPLLGIYEDSSQLFLVSPFMENGALNRWRKMRTPAVAEVHRVMLEVAEGMQHLHSEGIVHGNLHGENVLLDSEFHCKITDFGLTRHSDITVTQSTSTFFPNFAAPELFGMCPICGEPECNDNHDVQHRNKTMETDIYAFGCLYYATFFGVVPFHDKGQFQIVQLIMNGKHPYRLASPEMTDDLWNLIQSCWKSKPSERPTMDEIVATIKSSS